MVELVENFQDRRQRQVPCCSLAFGMRHGPSCKNLAGPLQFWLPPRSRLPPNARSTLSDWNKIFF